MNRRNFIKLLSRSAALLAAIPFVGIPEPEIEPQGASYLWVGEMTQKEIDNLKRKWEGIYSNRPCGIEPQETDYLSGTIAIDEGWSDQIVDWDGSAWEQIPT